MWDNILLQSDCGEIEEHDPESHPVAKYNYLATNGITIMLTTLILDFDGTIIDFHLENGGMSRYGKFRHIYANIFHESLTQEEEGQLANEYAGLIFDAMLIVPYVAGTTNCAEREQQRAGINTLIRRAVKITRGFLRYRHPPQ